MNNFKDYPLMESNKKHINLFYPYISKKSFKSIKATRLSILCILDSFPKTLSAKLILAKDFIF